MKEEEKRKVVREIVQTADELYDYASDTLKKIYNITLHDVQLHGAIALYEGNIAEIEVNGTKYQVELDKELKQSKNYPNLSFL